jgi:hypothetical protein
MSDKLCLYPEENCSFKLNKKNTIICQSNAKRIGKTDCYAKNGVLKYANEISKIK